ncbi:ZnF C2H2 [Geosmithia morbida]|uniref:ZnF C2H2 n=1 Tax=Geosmithia morbida TaxID=1094350 RepID=A0A9P4YP54_9HYPO|nr:ZnF C2H2 [Geosmithia morbida]KAF4120012.1 ZnF C2H2 [Geosmithia morbida]
MASDWQSSFTGIDHRPPIDWDSLLLFPSLYPCSSSDDVSLDPPAASHSSASASTAAVTEASDDGHHRRYHLLDRFDPSLLGIGPWIADIPDGDGDHISSIPPDFSFGLDRAVGAASASSSASAAAAAAAAAADLGSAPPPPPPHPLTTASLSSSFESWFYDPDSPTFSMPTNSPLPESNPISFDPVPPLASSAAIMFPHLPSAPRSIPGPPNKRSRPYPPPTAWSSSSPPATNTCDQCFPPRHFKRRTDLTRHVQTTHEPLAARESFYCDYQRCPRYSEPFHRRDHWRDHYRDYHNEDLEKRGRGRAPADDAWFINRNTDPSWWRCGHCLDRVRVPDAGFECPSCGEVCCAKRRAVRL